MSVDNTDPRSVACSQRRNILHCVCRLLSTSAAAAARSIHTTGM